MADSNIPSKSCVECSQLRQALQEVLESTHSRAPAHYIAKKALGSKPTGNETRARHVIECNYQRGPIGGEGCICVVVNRNEVPRDAARYRWLRDHAQHSVTLTFTDEETGHERSTCWGQIPQALDEQIDKALTKANELKASEHLYVPVSSGNDTCSGCGKPKLQCLSENGNPQ